MEEIISEYKKLLELIDEENVLIAKGLQGELLEMYRNILAQEKDEIEKYLQIIYQIK